MASPPAWLLAALAAPHVFALLPLLAREQLAGVAARLGHTDAAVPYTAGSLVLGCGQAGAVLQWLVEARSAGGDAGLPLAARVALATPLLIAGALLKLGAARVLRRSGLYFGRQLHAARECTPLSSDWPFSLLAHPDYCGSALLLLGGACLFFTGPAAPEGAWTVLLFWEFLYAASAMAEEAYACAGQPQPVLKPGQNPFWNNMARPEVRLHAWRAAHRQPSRRELTPNVRRTMWKRLASCSWRPLHYCAAAYSGLLCSHMVRKAAGERRLRLCWHEQRWP